MASKRDELLTVAQVLAELGNVSQRTFYRWREIGELAGVPGKRGILRRMVTAALDDPDGTVRRSSTRRCRAGRRCCGTWRGS